MASSVMVKAWVMDSLDLISDYCENLFYKNDDSRKLLVFLPSVNGKGSYPYYPRISWGRELAEKYNVLYLSDPYQNNPIYKVPMGSWFISPDGKSTIDEIADRINLLVNKLSVEKVLFYGSSMGGYASLMLSALVSGSKSIAECPQLYLNKHPGSRYVCEEVLDKNIENDAIEPLRQLINGRQGEQRIICSLFDTHYKQHIVPFLEAIKNQDLDINLSVNIYSDSAYKKGHVALNKKDAFIEIDMAMGF